MNDRRPWFRRGTVLLVLAFFGAELAWGWPSLTAAMTHLRAPHPGWFAAAVVAEFAAIGAYARMQRRLLRAAGLRTPLRRNLALTLAAHSLNETLPGGPAFSTAFNYQQMRRFGATPAVASWCIALSGTLSATALAVVTAAGALASRDSPSWGTVLGLTAVVIALTAGLRHLTRHPASIKKTINWSYALANRFLRRPSDYGTAQAHTFLDQLGTARLTPGHATVAAALAVLNWLLDAVCLWFCFLAVSDQPPHPAQLLLAFCAGMAAGTVTVVPGGLGIIDSALILGLATSGVDTPAAIAVVILYRIVSFGFIIGLGWLTWLTIRRHDRSTNGLRPPPSTEPCLVAAVRPRRSRSTRRPPTRTAAKKLPG